MLGSLEQSLLKELLGPVVAELEKVAEADLAAVKAKVESDVDGIAARVGVPAATVNAGIDAVFAAIDRIIVEVGSAV